MWQDRLRPCAVFTETSEGFAPYYLAGIRHDLSQTTAYVGTFSICLTLEPVKASPQVRTLGILRN